MHRAALAIVAVLAVLAVIGSVTACGEKPVTCKEFKTDYGDRPSLTTLNKAVNGKSWSQCDDGKVRKVTCTPGHLSAWKCLCSIDGQDKIEARRDKDVADDRAGATSDANAMCHWKLQ